MNRYYLFIGIIILLNTYCSSQKPLTDQEKAKLDPPMIRLLSGEKFREGDVDFTLRRDGTKEYAAIVRTEHPEEVKNLGVTISSIFGDVLVVHATIEELRKIISLTSVRSVQAGSKNTIQQNK